MLTPKRPDTDLDKFHEECALFGIYGTIDAAAHTALLQLHRIVGLSVWVLTFFRLAWRRFAEYPDWPDDMSEAMRTLAKSSEYGLYCLLLLQPLLGLLQTNAHGERANLFFLGQLPAVIGRDLPLAKQFLARAGEVLADQGLKRCFPMPERVWRASK